jgi:hypothetical protein
MGVGGGGGLLSRDYLAPALIILSWCTRPVLLMGSKGSVVSNLGTMWSHESGGTTCDIQPLPADTAEDGVSWMLEAFDVYLRRSMDGCYTF